MDVLMLSRLQFAAATMFHFIFVPLTLGLSVLIAIMETKYVTTGDEVYKKMAKFWGKIFLVNFALGIVTGITLEFQFGTNWSRYSMFVGDVFGSLLAIEATAAFFLESTFIGVWHFGWNKLSPKAHAIVAWLVAGASNLSAVWILIANGFMQDPKGFVLRNGRAEMTDFIAIITNKWAWLEFFHVIPAALCLSGFFIMGVAAWHILRKSEVDFFQRSFNIGVTVALIFSIFVAVEGHMHGNNMSLKQPAKLAAMESHWETQRNAPLNLLVIPGEDGNVLEALPVPGALSFMAYNDFNAEVKGLNDIPKEDRPPIVITFLAFRTMVGIGTAMIALAAFGWVMRNKLDKFPKFLKMLPYFIPVPYIGIWAGWTLAEVGRQPWIVYGVMRTSDAVSPVGIGEVSFSFIMMCLIYSLLGACGIWLMIRLAKKGPEDNTPIQV